MYPPSSQAHRRPKVSVVKTAISPGLTVIPFTSLACAAIVALELSVWEETALVQGELGVLSPVELRAGGVSFGLPDGEGFLLLTQLRQPLLLQE